MDSLNDELADIKRRLDDAVFQLREQEQIVAVIDETRSPHDTIVSLLSLALEQFYRIKSLEKTLAESSTLQIENE